MQQLTLDVDVLPVHSEGLAEATTGPEQEARHVGQPLANGEVVAVEDGQPLIATLGCECPGLLATLHLQAGHVTHWIDPQAFASYRQSTDTGDDGAAELGCRVALLTAFPV